MPQSTPVIEVPDERSSVWRHRLGCIGAIVAVVLLIVALPLSVYLVEMSRGRRALQAEVTRLRARKTPLTTIELHELYQAAAGDSRVGANLIDALAVASDPQVAALGKPLPLVGTGPETPIPNLDQAWEPQMAVADYLATHEKFLALIKEHAAQRTKVRYSVDLTPGVFTQIPHVQQLRHGARVQTLQFHLDLFQGRTDAAIERLNEMVFLAETLGNEPFLVSQLVRLAITGMAFKNLEYLLANVTLTDEQLARLQLAFRQVDMPGGLNHALDGERATSYTASTWPIQVAASGVATQPLSNDEITRLAKRGPRNPGDAALMLSLFRRLQEAGDESLAAAAAEAAVIDTELKQLKGSHRSVLHMHTLMLFPAVHSSIKAFQRGSGRCLSADACLAALRYRQAQGEWSQTLRELVPQYLPAEPIDPYTGKPLVYKTTATEVKVYSLGENGIDDGGTWTDSQWTDVGFAAPWRTTP